MVNYIRKMWLRHYFWTTISIVVILITAFIFFHIGQANADTPKKKAIPASNDTRILEAQYKARQATTTTTTTTTVPKPLVIPSTNTREAPNSSSDLAPSSFSIPSEEQKNEWLRQAGIPESVWPQLKAIINGENALWCPTRSYGQKGCPATPGNTSKAYGIPQSYPGTKMASMGADWMTNHVTQLRWMQAYVLDRYGTWDKALTYKRTNGTY
jgi:hypothetical protein